MLRSGNKITGIIGIQYYIFRPITNGLNFKTAKLLKLSKLE